MHCKDIPVFSLLLLLLVPLLLLETVEVAAALEALGSDKALDLGATQS